jgi:hypothetical protein
MKRALCVMIVGENRASMTGSQGFEIDREL